MTKREQEFAELFEQLSPEDQAKTFELIIALLEEQAASTKTERSC